MNLSTTKIFEAKEKRPVRASRSIKIIMYQTFEASFSSVAAVIFAKSIAFGIFHLNMVAHILMLKITSIQQRVPTTSAVLIPFIRIS